MADEFSDHVSTTEPQIVYEMQSESYYSMLSY